MRKNFEIGPECDKLNTPLSPPFRRSPTLELPGSRQGCVPSIPPIDRPLMAGIDERIAGPKQRGLTPFDDPQP